MTAGDGRTVHVVLVTYGEPPTPAFAGHLAYSWRILLGLTRTIADIPRPLLPLIALARARTRNRNSCCVSLTPLVGANASVTARSSPTASVPTLVGTFNFTHAGAASPFVPSRASVTPSMAAYPAFFSTTVSSSLLLTATPVCT